MFGCCCSCADGGTIPRWQNVTQVRPVADPTPAGTPVAPFQRYDSNEYLSEHGIGHSCDDDNPAGSGSDFSGYCGEWFGSAGDTNALSSQVVKDIVDDIMACAGDDATHAKIDHDCYAVNGTVNMKAKRLGGMWLLAKKSWHGTPPWTDKDYCTPDPTNAPNQVRYRTINYSAALATKTSDGGSPLIDLNRVSDTASGSMSIDRYSGILTNNLLTTEQIFSIDPTTLAETQIRQVSGGAGWLSQSPAPNLVYVSGLSTKIDGAVCTDVHCAAIPLPFDYSYIPPPFVGYADIKAFVVSWSSTPPAPVGDFTWPTLPAISDNNNYDSGELHEEGVLNPTDDPSLWETSTLDMRVSWSRTATVYTWSFMVDWSITTPSGTLILCQINWGGTLTLSDPYTSADCLQDWKAAMAAWNAADRNLAKLRTDEKLALAPLILYDEIAPQTPLQGFLPVTMDNYAGGLVDDLNGNHPGSHAGDAGQKPTGAPVDYTQTWAQTGWLDPQDYKWLGADGSANYSTVDASGNPPDDTTLAGVSFGILKTGLRTGGILAHVKGSDANHWSGAGADRHFWFGYVEMKRICCVEDCSTGYTWVPYRNGGFSDPDLPPVTMRWMDNAEAQYDGELCNPAAYSKGNFPDSWLHEQGGYIVGGKQITATQKWPAVKFCRPCGVDKYAVSQETVCCFTGDATAGFDITLTFNATTLPAHDDYILVGGVGLFKVDTVIAGHLTTTTTTPLDTLPAGLGDQSIASGDYLGVLRWTGYTNYGVTFDSVPGICLRVPVTTGYTAGVLTVTSAATLPFFRKGTDAALRAVNLYDASMTLLASGLVLTRTDPDDHNFTATTSDHPTAVWMMDAQFAGAISAGATTDWTKYDGTSKRTVCAVEWTFNQRQAALPVSGPPPIQPHWLGWTADVDGERGIAGCLTQSVAQYTLESSKCPAFVGFVPFYDGAPVETFTGAKKKLLPMPSTFGFDDIYGAHSQQKFAISMPDPFWQNPFMPSCDGAITWKMDDGSGTGNYAHYPMVEALSTVPAGCSLPDGTYLLYDTAHVVVAPPFYPNGIPTVGGDYEPFETDWGFAIRACGCIAGSGRFAADYAYVDCSNVP